MLITLVTPSPLTGRIFPVHASLPSREVRRTLLLAYPHDHPNPNRASGGSLGDRATSSVTRAFHCRLLDAYRCYLDEVSRVEATATHLHLRRGIPSYRLNRRLRLPPPVFGRLSVSLWPPPMRVELPPSEVLRARTRRMATR